MDSKYQPTKGSQLYITEKPYSKDGENTYVSLGCLMNEASYTGGAKTDIPVTTLCSVMKEQTNGLPDPGEVTFSGNWVVNNEVILILREAYRNDKSYGFKFEFPDDLEASPPIIGGGYIFTGQVKQENFSVATDSVLNGGFTVRMTSLMEEIPSGS